YAKERIAEGGLQTVGGVVSVVTGLGLIVATGGMATPVVAGAFVVGTCSMTYGISNTEEGLDNLYYGIKGDGKSIAVNPIRDSIFKSNPQLYYTIGNASTIISSMGATIASGVPGEQVMATQTKRLASGAVGSIASNVLIEEYDMNPYIAMGIGMGISGLTYRGINSIEVDTTMGITASGGKEVNGVEDIKEISKVEKLTSNSVKKIINDNDMTVDEFSKLL